MKYLQEVAWLEQEYPNMCKLLIDWAETNSGTLNLSGIALMQKKIKSLFAHLDAKIQVIPAAPYSVINDIGQEVTQTVGDVIHLHKRPNAERQIILCGHCDTVFAKETTFQHVEKLNDNILKGPGVADMKGGLLVMYYALMTLEQSPYKDKLGWQVFINADEEIGSLGSASILARLTDNVDLGFVYEPAINDKGTLAYHRKGSGNFTLCVQGKAAHVGRAFEQGRSAIVALAALITQLHQLNKDDNLTVNVGKVNGGEVLNQVPDFALCRVNVRTKTQHDEKQFLEKLTLIIDAIGQAYQVTVSSHGGFTRKPKVIADETEKLYSYVIQQAKYLDMTLETQSTGGCCDGNNLSFLGIPNVDTLGVLGGKIHTHDEYINLASLVQRAKLSALLFMRIAHGDY